MSRRSMSFDSGDNSPSRSGPKRPRGSADTGRRRSPHLPPRGNGSYSVGMNDNHQHATPTSSSKTGFYRALCVTDIDDKVGDDTVKDALSEEYRRFGEVSVMVVREPGGRVAYLSYKNADDARYAEKNKPLIMFYNKPVRVSPVYEPEYEEYHHRSSRRSPSPGRFRRPSPGPPPPLPYSFNRDPYLLFPPAGYPPGVSPFDPLLPPLPPRRYDSGSKYQDFPPPPGSGRGGRRGSRHDRFPNYLRHVAPEDDPLACRTLFAGNLEAGISENELARIFGRYGRLEDVDVKRPSVDGGGRSAFAFVRYENVDMAHQAKISLSGQYIGKYVCKIGYGKPVPTVKVWVGGLGGECDVQLLEREFDRFGAIKKIEYEEGAVSAYVTYDSIDAAKAAVAEMRGARLGGPTSRIRIDFGHVDGQSDPGKPPPRGEELGDRFVSGRNASGSRGGGGCRGGRIGYARDFPPPVYDPHDPFTHVVPRRPLPLPDMVDHDRLPRVYRPRSPFVGASDRWSPPPFASHVGRVEVVRVVDEVERIVPVCWEGGIVLKTSRYDTKLHLIRGDPSTIRLLDGVLKIAQRLRLEQSKMDDILRRLNVSSAHAICLGLPAHTPPPPLPCLENGAVQDRPLKNLVTYLKQKDAAGVISFQSSEGVGTGIVYAFPPCHFSFELLRVSYPGIIEDVAKDDHVVVLIVT